MSKRDSHQSELEWFKAFEAALHGLPTEDRLDVVHEVRSHFENRAVEDRDAGCVLTRARDTGQTVTMFATLAPLARRSAIAGVGLALALFF